MISSLTYLVQAAFGNWDVEIFLTPRVYVCDPPKSYNCYSVPKIEIDKYLGLLYMLIFLVLNMVILLNLVIAILATVYNEYSQFKRGLYFDTLIAALPKYRHDRYYGYLQAFPGIFAPLLLLSLPFAFILR